MAQVHQLPEPRLALQLHCLLEGSVGNNEGEVTEGSLRFNAFFNLNSVQTRLSNSMRLDAHGMRA